MISFGNRNSSEPKPGAPPNLERWDDGVNFYSHQTTKSPTGNHDLIEPTKSVNSNRPTDFLDFIGNGIEPATSQGVLTPFEVVEQNEVLVRSHDLDDAAKVKGSYERQRGILAESVLERQFYMITRNNAFVTGPLLGLTHAPRRSRALINYLEKHAIERLPSADRDEDFIVRDVGASTGTVSLAVYDFLEKRYGGRLQFTASDVATQLLFIRDEQGASAVFSNIPPSRGENLLQVKTDERVFISRPLVDKIFEENVPLGPFITDSQVVGSLSTKFVAAFHGLVEQGERRPELRYEAITLFDPRVDEIIRETPRFRFCQADLFLPLKTNDAPAHLIICMNTLNEKYYSREQIRDGLRALGQGLRDNGLLLVVNDWIDRDSLIFYRDISHRWQYPYTLFGRERESLVALSYTSSMQYSSPGSIGFLLGNPEFGSYFDPMVDPIDL